MQMKNWPQSAAALLWLQLLEGFGFVWTQKSFMVIVCVAVVLGGPQNPTLLLCGFGTAADDAEGKAP